MGFFLLLASAHLPIRALQVAVKDLRRGRFVPPLAQSCCLSVRPSARRSSFPVYFCRVLFNVFFAAHAQLLQHREKTNVNKEKILSARDTTGSTANGGRLGPSCVTEQMPELKAGAS